jgi:hypothetical protein
MATKREAPRSVRLNADEHRMLEELSSALTRERAPHGGRISANEAIKTAIREAYERRRGQLAADRAAWDGLVALAPSPIAMLTLEGKGAGEPRPERREQGTAPDGQPATYRTPALWDDLEVSAALDGQLVDLPLLLEKEQLHFNVFLTDEHREARIYLGPLSRVVEEYPAYYDNRVHRIGADLRLALGP